MKVICGKKTFVFLTKLWTALSEGVNLCLLQGEGTGPQNHKIHMGQAGRAKRKVLSTEGKKGGRKGREKEARRSA